MSQALVAIIAAVSIAAVAVTRDAGVTARSHRQPGSATAASRCPGPPPEPPHPLARPQWLSGVVITEYYPAPERWFVGERVRTPGMTGRHAVDWLYSAHGLSMEGDGIDRTGHIAHIQQLGSSGWVNPAGHSTQPVCLGQWSNGRPYWRGGGWRNDRGEVTFALAGGGWSNGRPRRDLPYGGITFAAGPSLPLNYYRSVAVDPKLIPEGSRIYIPAYRPINGGWFKAADTGGAIKSRHIDVYRPPPASPSDQGRYMTGQRVYVIPPR
jgi:3D (Asp-Asp-Asp) domain-containing protein